MRIGRSRTSEIADPTGRRLQSASGAADAVVDADQGITDTKVDKERSDLDGVARIIRI
jgi:hypothetical protein